MKKLSLVGYEFQKQLTRFNILLVVFALILYAGALIWQLGGQFSPDAGIFRAEKLRLLELYAIDPDEYERLYDDYRSRLTAYETSCLGCFTNSQKSMPEFQNVLLDLDDYGDRELFNDVEDTINSSKDRTKEIESLLHETSERLLASENTDGYTYTYYVRLLKKYDAVADISWEIAPIFGWNEFFSENGASVFLPALSIGLFNGVFTFERRHKLSNIIRLTKRGSVSLASAKLIYITLSSAALTVLFTLLPLAVTTMSCGLSGGSLPVQALDGFSLCPYRLTIIEYLFVFVAFGRCSSWDFCCFWLLSTVSPVTSLLRRAPGC